MVAFGYAMQVYCKTVCCINCGSNTTYMSSWQYSV